MLRLATACLLAFLATTFTVAQDKPDDKEDPKNSNKKLVGKWKITEMPGLGKDELKMMESLKIYPFMEFTAKGGLTLGVYSADPDTQKLIERNAGKTKIECKYKVLAGDEVEFYDLPKELQNQGGVFGKKDRAKVTLKIDGDTMTMTDEEKKTGKLVRMKEPMKEKPKDEPEKK